MSASNAVPQPLPGTTNPLTALTVISGTPGSTNTVYMAVLPSGANGPRQAFRGLSIQNLTGGSIWVKVASMPHPSPGTTAPGTVGSNVPTVAKTSSNWDFKIDRAMTTPISIGIGGNVVALYFEDDGGSGTSYTYGTNWILKAAL